MQNESTTFVPIAATGTLEGVPVAQLSVVNGTATAVWEVLGTVVDLNENYDFAIWAQSGPIPGTATITASYAPAPPAFAATGAGAASATLPVPRFLSTAAAVPLFNTNACSVAAPTSTSLTSAGASAQYNLTATVTTPNPALTGTPAGTVTFYDNGAVIAGSLTTLSSAGMANYSANLPIGTHRLTAVFTPANTQLFTASTSPGLSLSVNAHSATNIEITSSSNPSLPGQAVTFIANVTGSAATGTIQFTDGLRSLGGATLVGSRASVTVTLATVGVHDIFATYSGDGGNTDASARFAQTVSRVTDSLALTTSAAAAVFGQPVTLNATLASQAPAGVPAATGTVQFQEGPAVIGTAPLAGRTATLAVSNLAPGVHPIVAVYSGDANWYGLHSSPLTLNISRGTTNTTLTSSATIAEVRLAATLTPAPSGGTVQFLDTAGNTALGTASLVNGTATLALTPSDAAKIAGHPVAAIYSGSAALAGSTSNTLVVPALRNAAGGTLPEFAPDELVSLYGSKLADTEAAAPMPQSLGGLSVTIADATGAVFPAGLSYVSPSQINFLIPSTTPRGAALVTIVRAGTVVAAVPVTIASVAPGIFAASQLVRTESGAAYLVLYGTGIRNRTGNATVTCMMKGTPLPVTYAGAQPDYAGLDQVNVPLPSDLRPTGTLSVSLMVDGKSSNVITVDMQ